MAIVVIALAIRSYAAVTAPLWTDELFTRFYSQVGLGFLWGAGLRTEPTSPLYYTLIAALERIAGSSAILLRLPSVLGSTAAVILAWQLGQELFGRRSALIGALLLALAPISVFHAAEARTYALQGAALGAVLLGVARVLQGRSGFALYAAGAVLSIWLHPTSVLAIASCNLAALACGRTLGRAGLTRWAMANVAVLLLCLPLVPALLWPASGGAATTWIPALSRWSLEQVVGETLAGPAIGRGAPLVAEAAGLILALLVLVPPWRPGWRAAIVLVAIPGLTLALMIGVSAVKPVLLSRTLAWMALPLAVALGGVASRRPKAVGVLLVAVVAAGLLAQIERGAAASEDWPGLFAQMGDLAPPTLMVLAPHSPPGAPAVYAPTARDVVRLDDGMPAVPETAVMPRLFGTRTITLAEMTAAIHTGRPVWFVYRRPEYAWAQHALAELPPPRESVQSEAGTNPALRAVRW